MNLIFAATVGTLFASGVFLLLKADLLRVVVGLVLVSNAANLTLIASGLSRGVAPIVPTSGAAADPLVQAMTLTALVIGFAVTAVLLALVVAVHRARGSIDLDELGRQETQFAAQDEAREDAHDEEQELETQHDTEYDEART